MRFLKALILIIAFLGSLPSSNAQTPQKELTIAMRLVSPFVMKDGDKLTGFSVELWELIAKEMNRSYKAEPKETLAATFEDIKSGKADAAIAAISITSEREKTFDFSLPMFDSGLQIMTHADRAEPPSLVKGLIDFFKSKDFREMAGLFLILMLLPIPFIWLFEKKEKDGELIGHEKFSGQLIKTLWWSSTALLAQSTHMPYSILGRIFAVMWMLVSVVFISYFTATFTAGLTVKQLESSLSNPRELAGKRVASVKDSTGAKFLKTVNADLVEVANIQEAYKMLEAKTIVAIVYDAPILLYHASHTGKGKVAMVGSIFQNENYGILLQDGSPLRKDINAALLKVREKGDYEKLYIRWFGLRDE